MSEYESEYEYESSAAEESSEYGSEYESDSENEAETTPAPKKEVVATPEEESEPEDSDDDEGGVKGAGVRVVSADTSSKLVVGDLSSLPGVVDVTNQLRDHLVSSTSTIFNDCGASAPVIVEMDGFILQCLSKYNLTRSVEEKDVSSLAVVYILQTIMDTFLNPDGFFYRLVFFKNSAPYWTSPAGYAIRGAVRAFLQASSPEILAPEFESPVDPAWAAYVEEFSPYAITVADSLILEDDSVGQAWLAALTSTAVSARLQVVILIRTCIFNTRKLQVHLSLGATNVLSLSRVYLSKVAAKSVELSVAHVASVLSKGSSTTLEGDATVESVVLAAVKAAAPSTATEKFVARLLLSSAAVKDTVGLKARSAGCVSWEALGVSEKEASAFLASVDAGVACLLPAVSLTSDIRTIADIRDHRFVRVLASACAAGAFLEIPEASMAACAAAGVEGPMAEGVELKASPIPSAALEVNETLAPANHPTAVTHELSENLSINDDNCDDIDGIMKGLGLDRASIVEAGHKRKVAHDTAVEMAKMKAAQAAQRAGDMNKKKEVSIPVQDSEVLYPTGDFVQLSTLVPKPTKTEEYKAKSAKAAKRMKSKITAFLQHASQNLLGPNHKRKTVLSGTLDADPEHLAAEKAVVDAKAKKAARHQKGGKKGGKPKKMTKAEQMKFDNLKRVEEGRIAFFESAWVKAWATANGNPHFSSVEKFFTDVEKENNPGVTGSAVQMARLSLIEFSRAQWEKECYKQLTGDDRDMSHVVEVFTHCFKSAVEAPGIRDRKSLKKIVAALSFCGLTDAARNIRDFAVRQDEARKAAEADATKAAGGKKGKKKDNSKDSGKKGKKEEKGLSCSIPSRADDADRFDVDMTAAKFQLKFMSERMGRDVGAENDARVPFIPDPWQRELLDVVDKNESALVCAPTSSGKTFVAYYVVERILRQSDTARMVFVVPTRPLVNQTSIDIYARYSKSSSVVSGVVLPDYERDSLKAQVLITTPQCLGRILRSPEYKEFRENLKYVLIDEVHTLSRTANMALLAQLPVPFVALSATVGEPEKFISRIEQERSTMSDPNLAKVNLVQHQHRFSDLRKYVFMPLPRSREFKISSVHEKRIPGSFKPIPVHPVSVLDPTKMPEKEFPPALSMTSDELLALHATMVKIAAENPLPAELARGLSSIDPNTYFMAEDPLGLAYISKGLCRRWETEVKSQVLAWGKHANPQCTTLIEAVSATNAVAVERAMEWAEEGVEVDERTFLSGQMMNLLVSLNSQKRLPVIVFNHSAQIVESLARGVVESLEEKEAEFRERHSKTAAREEAEQKKQAAIARRLETRRKLTREDQEMKEMMSTEGATKKLEVEPAFNFMRHGESLPVEEKRHIRSLKWALKNSGYDSNSFVVRALDRGIGIHHPSLPQKYRATVERLFRSGTLRVIFATATLALGIHMPCRTVVLAGDNTHLDSTEYRQMSGRAGRRGFDLEGHVVFFGFSKRRRDMLMSVQVPRLHFNPRPRFQDAVSWASAWGPESAERSIGSQLLGVSDCQRALAPVATHHMESMFRSLGLLDSQGAPTALFSFGLQKSCPAFYLPSVIASGVVDEVFERVAAAGSAAASRKDLVFLTKVFSHTFRPLTNVVVTRSARNNMIGNPLPEIDEVVAHIDQTIVSPAVRSCAGEFRSKMASGSDKAATTIGAFESSGKQSEVEKWLLENSSATPATPLHITVNGAGDAGLHLQESLTRTQMLFFDTSSGDEYAECEDILVFAINNPSVEKMNEVFGLRDHYHALAGPVSDLGFQAYAARHVFGDQSPVALALQALFEALSQLVSDIF